MRFPDWQLRFSQFVAERQSIPFAWGRNDCCLFAADCVLALTGRDLAADYRGIYRSEKTAYKLLKELGGITALADASLGESVPPLRATVGDVVLVEINGREGLGICNGSTILGPGPHGIEVLGMERALACWKV